MIKRIIRILALLIVIAAFVEGIWIIRRMENDDTERLNDLYAQTEPLQQQRDALEQELASLDLEYTLNMRDVSTLQILFTELDSQVFTVAYPIMREYGVTGVLALSRYEYPGNGFNKLTIDQYNRLLMDGWDCCLLYENGYDYEYWHNSMVARLNYQAMEMPHIAAFLNDGYSEELDETLIRLGIDTVIFNAADGRSQVVQEIDPIWRVAAMPWNYTGALNDLEYLGLTNSGDLTLTVSFNDTWNAYEESSFRTTLETISSMLQEEMLVPDLQQQVEKTPEEELNTPVLIVTDYDTAREAHAATRANNLRLEKELEARRATLQEQIDSLTADIRAVYDHWDGRS